MSATDRDRESVCAAVHPGLPHDDDYPDACYRVLALIEKVRQAKDREWLNAFSIECDYSAAEAAAMINEDRAACEDIERRKATADAYRRGMQKAADDIWEACGIHGDVPDVDRECGGCGEMLIRGRVRDKILAKLAEKV